MSFYLCLKKRAHKKALFTRCPVVDKVLKCYKPILKLQVCNEVWNSGKVVEHNMKHKVTSNNRRKQKNRTP